MSATFAIGKSSRGRMGLSRHGWWMTKVRKLGHGVRCLCAGGVSGPMRQWKRKTWSEWPFVFDFHLSRAILPFMKHIIGFMIAGTVALAAFVHFNPNPNRWEHSSFGVVHTTLHVEQPTAVVPGSELRITKTGEWESAFAGRSQVACCGSLISRKA